MLAKRAPCVVMSPALDLKDVNVRDLVVFRTKDYSMGGAAAEGIRKSLRPHAFPLAASPQHNLDERWVDFTSQDSFPKSYLNESRWGPICRMEANYFEKLLRHYGRWLLRDQAGKF